jgi:hypothetical protein
MNTVIIRTITSERPSMTATEPVISRRYAGSLRGGGGGGPGSLTCVRAAGAVNFKRAIRALRKTEIAPIKRSAFPCNHIMTFPHELAWQYGGPSQQSGNEREIPPDAR